MGFYIRKSIKLGPLRVNLSKSGVGFSAGVKGARVGVDARGKRYLHLGRGGFYYREVLDGEEPVTGVSWGVIALVLLAAAFLWEFLTS
ncbi:MAG TPA: DUF4236 domain-containing protein [Candidatus Acidoferrales bacterium]|nr:DUF4236 domain-containing protein [Candidatus Acidoferrales bacterium]